MSQHAYTRRSKVRDSLLLRLSARQLRSARLRLLQLMRRLALSTLHPGPLRRHPSRRRVRVRPIRENERKLRVFGIPVRDRRLFARRRLSARRAFVLGVSRRAAQSVLLARGATSAMGERRVRLGRDDLAVCFLGFAFPAMTNDPVAPSRRVARGSYNVDRRPTRLVSSRLVSLFLVFNASFLPFDSKMRLRHLMWVNSERVDLHRRLATAPSRAISRAVRLRPASVRRAQHGDHARNQALRQVDVR